MSTTGVQTSITEQNKEIARRYLLEIGAAGALDRLEEFVSPDVVNHDPISGEQAETGTERGLQAFRRHAEALIYGLSDREFDVRDVIAEDDRVMVRVVLSGTHTGRFLEIDPTGRRVRFSSIVIYRIRNGKIVERWDEANNLGLLQQLGVLPELVPQPQTGQQAPATAQPSQQFQQPSQQSQQPVQQFQQQPHQVQPAQQGPSGVQQPGTVAQSPQVGSVQQPPQQPLQRSRPRSPGGP